MSNERGHIMLAMVVVVLVGSTSALLVVRSRTIARETETDLVKLTAFHAAEGALALARRELVDDADHAGARVTIGMVDVESTVTRTEAGWRVVVLARAGGVRIEADLAPTEGLPAVVSWTAR